MTLEIEHLGFAQSERYPYTVRIRVSTSTNVPQIEALNNLIDKIHLWARDNDIECIVAGGSFYVKSMEIASLFVLRWS